MGLSLEQKQAMVSEVATKLQGAQAVIVAEYRGLNVERVTQLRSKARKSGVYLRVLKNTLARRAIKGTPFEQMFQAFGGAFGGGPGGAGMPDLNALLGQMQAMMTPHEGSVNWTLAKDVARRTVAAEPDPTPTSKQRNEVADALRLADHWLDSATDLPSGSSSAVAWSRAEWVVGTTDVWKVLVEPIAQSSVQALGNAMPAETREMSGPLLGILGKAIGGMLAGQIGSGLGALAADVLSVSDIGLPLAAPGKAARSIQLLPKRQRAVRFYAPLSADG